MKTRREQLVEAKAIYDKMSKQGVYKPEEILEGFQLVFPDKPIPTGFAQRKQFVGYFQYLYADALKELDEFFKEMEELHEGAEEGIAAMQQEPKWRKDELKRREDEGLPYYDLPKESPKEEEVIPEVPEEEVVKEVVKPKKAPAKKRKTTTKKKKS